MTSRLRNKLDELEQSGRKVNESFCQIGTPLPPLADTKRDQGEFVPVWKQEVRDEQGRRRLHGAFTGGFSAGYYNTVGSKEGWTPSTFKSSRANRAQKVQKAEDFMDDEDLEQMRADRTLENTDTFRTDGFGSTADELGSRRGELPSALSSLIQPASTSIGQKMLMQLGWRPGQGVGPRVSARKRALQEAKAARLAGLPPPPAQDAGADGDDDAEMKKHTFAPRDAKMLVYDPKQGRQGLGFARGPGEPALARHGGVGGNSNSRAETSAGFGLGLEDADEDDEDVYHAGPGREQSTLGAFEGGEEGGDVILLGDSLASRDPKAQGKAMGPGPAAPPSRQGFWNDGRPVLPGFVLDTKAVTQDKWFAFPSIPADWHPRPSRVWSRISRWDREAAEAPAPSVNAMGLGKRPQSADERGQALGETVRVAPLKSVFDYMSAKSKERLAKFATVSVPGAEEEAAGAGGKDEATDPSDMTGLEIPPLSPRTASAALMGFIPFGDDLPKQDRYKAYLQSQTYNSTAQPKFLPVKSVEVINKELQDFSKSATIFKPMSFAMANRFTSSKSSAADMKQPTPGLHMPDPSKIDEAAKEQAAANEIVEELTAAQAAARAGFFGERTRVVQEWYPNKLLCKRFGVADPHPEGEPGKAAPPTSEGPAAAAAITAPPPDLAWTEKYVHQSRSQAGPPVAAAAPTAAAPPTTAEPRRPRNIAEVGLAGDESQGQDILTYEKPSIDIFRAIFQDESSDDEDDEESPSPGKRQVAEAEGKSLKQAEQPLPSVGRLQQPTPAMQPSLGGLDFEIISETTIAEPYKPIVFQPKSKDGADDADRKKSKRAKKEKNKAKKNTKILMSFDVADGEEDEVFAPRSSKKRKDDGEADKPVKKSKVAEPQSAADDEDEWVEAAPAPAAIVSAPPPVEPRAGVSGRKKASDFL